MRADNSGRIEPSRRREAWRTLPLSRTATTYSTGTMLQLYPVETLACFALVMLTPKGQNHYSKQCSVFIFLPLGSVSQNNCGQCVLFIPT